MPNTSGMVGSALGTGMSMVGAHFGNQAAQKGMSNDRNTQIMNLLAQNQAKADSLGYQAGYRDLGKEGLAGLTNFDLQANVGPDVSYDTEYTNKLGDYESSPAFQAQNQLGQQDLARSRTARGLDFGAPGASANASAELSQRLRATDFDKYRGDLAQRYSALQGEYALRQQKNKDRYSQLMDYTKIGQHAADKSSDITGNYSNLTSGIMTGVGKSFSDQGKAQGAYIAGQGATAGQGLKDMMSAGAGGGWFGK